jgi:hypothetical protein
MGSPSAMPDGVAIERVQRRSITTSALVCISSSSYSKPVFSSYPKISRGTQMRRVILKHVAQTEAIVITQQMRARYAMLTIGFGASELPKRWGNDIW